MTLVAGFPPPRSPSRFRASVEPWTIGGYPDPGAPRQPTWSAAADASALNSDITSGASYVPAGSETNWYFRAAVGQLLPEGRSLYGGTLAYALDTSAAAPDTPASPVPPSTPDLILKAGSLEMGLSIPEASPLA